MKKRFILFLLTVLALPLVAGKRQGVEYYLYDSFEDATASASLWTQQQVAGQLNWVAEQNGQSSYPAAAMDGSSYFAFRGVSGVTQGATTRLVSPVMDLSQVFEPVLVFNRYMAQYTGDVDTLNVYFRTSNSSRWTLLKSYAQRTLRWTSDTLMLPNKTNTYQICLEAKDGAGRGIAIDEVQVRDMPSCELPNNLVADSLTSNDAYLRWLGSFDTDSFRLLVSEAKITDMNNVDETKIVCDTWVKDFSYGLHNLKRNTTYYVYLHASCAETAEDWGAFTFATKNMVSLPYSEGFNLNLASGTVGHVGGWSYGTSIEKSEGGMEFMPFVNQNSSESALGNYSYDKTTCLVFSGARSLTTYIPAGQYVYAASPEMDVEDIRTLEVTFWGSPYNTFGADSKSALLVGVMTNPDDAATFVVVDTVYAVGTQTFNEYVVSLANYQGEGKYVAFMSRFDDKDNIFFLDDVRIAVRPAVSKGQVKRVSNVLSEGFLLDAQATGASKYNVWVFRDSLRTYLDPTEMASNLSVMQVQGVTMPYMVTLPEGENGCFMQVYVQGVNGSDVGEWSLPKKVQVPMAVADSVLPYDIKFEETDTWTVYQLNNFCTRASGLGLPWNVESRLMDYGNTVYTTTSYGQNGKGVMLGKGKDVFTDGSIRQEQTEGDYIAVPAVDSVKNVAVKFAAKAYSSTAIKAAGLRVGVMTDPYDITTFTEVARVTPDEAFQEFLVSFGDYQGQGRFIAIQAVDGAELYKYSSTSGSGGSYTSYRTSANSLDNIQLLPMSGCAIATGTVADAQDTVANLSWQANGMTSWQLQAATDEAMTNLIADTVVTAPAYQLTGLNAHSTYYWQVTTLCGEDSTVGLVNHFTTSCAVNGEKLPYFEGFEDYKASSTIRQFPYCWTGTQKSYSYSGDASTSYYPYFGSTANYSHGGKQYMFWGFTSSASEMYFALPMMADSINKLMLNMWIRPSVQTYKDTLEVGVMTDPADLATFETVQQITVSGSGYSEYRVSLASYAGQGKYIAVRKGSDTHTYFIDDIKVDYLSPCEKIMKVTATDANTHGVTVNWQDMNQAPQFEVMITKSEVVDLSTPGTALLIDTVVSNANSCVIYDETKLAINEPYYIYVRALCSSTSGSEWSNVISFRTQCTAQSVAEAAEDFTDAGNINCWTLGAQQGTNYPTRNTNGYLYMYTPKTGDGSYAIMPPLDVDSISKYQITFQAHGGTSATAGRNLSVGVVSNLSDFSTYVGMKQFDLPLVSNTGAATGYGFNEAPIYTVRFNTYQGDADGVYGKNVMFLAQNGEVPSYAYIDNIVVEALGSCLEPLDLEADSTGATGAHIIWDGDSTATYEVQILTGKMGEAGAQIVADTLVVGNEVTIEGLEMLQKYYMYARTICGDGDTSRWSNMRYFETACPAKMPLPYVEDFDSYGTPRTSVPYDEPNCWNAWYNGIDGTLSSTNARLNASAKMGSTGAGYYMGSYMYKSTSATDTVYRDAYAVLPAIDADLSTAMVSFFAKANSTTGNRTLTIGVADYNEPLDSVMNYTPVETVEISGTTFQYYSVQLTPYQGTGKHIVLHMHHGTGTSSSSVAYLYLDDLKVEAMPSCFTPVSLNAAAVGKSEMKLSWVPQGNETSWQVGYVEKDGDVKEVTLVDADSSTFVVTGLNPSTTYDFYVRANCGEEISAWSDKTTAQTLCLVDIENAHWDFENHDEMSMVKYATTTSYVNYSCWMGDNAGATSYSYIPYVYPTAKPTTATAAMYGYRSDFSLRIGTTSTYKPAYAVLPELNADLDTLQLRFKATSAYISNRSTGALSTLYSKGTTYPHSIKVGVMTDPTDFSTFEEMAEYVFPEITVANCSLLVDTFAYWNEYTLPLYGASGKFIAFVSDYNATNYVYIDDVVVEKEQGCAAPSKLEATNVTANSAHLAWGSSKSKWNLVVKEGETEVLNTEVTGTPEYTITGLHGATDYSFEVQAYCEAGALSDWSSATFATLCDKFDSTEAKWNFQENNLPYVTGSTVYVIPQCWNAGQLEKTSATSNSYMPYAIANTTTYQYGRDLGTTDRALRFYNYASSTTRYAGSYAVLPELDVNTDSTALHFWYRAAYFYTPTYTTQTLRERMSASNLNYPKDLVVGVISDINDMSTFTPVQTVSYTALSTSSNTTTFAYDDPKGNSYWQEAVIPMSKLTGGRIVLYYTGDATGYMFVDDIDIVDAEFCTAPSTLTVSAITGTSAELGWSMISDSVDLQVSTDAAFETTIVDTRLDADNYALSNLQPATTYYYRLRSACAEGETSEWNESNFRTYYSVRFHEEFTAVTTYPTDWVRYSKKAADVFDGGNMGNPISETATACWKRSPSSVGMNAGHMIVDNYGPSVKYWLVTPVIDVPATVDSLMLSFDLGMTNGQTHDGSAAQLNGDDDRFLVAVSEDGGKTWSSANKTEWNNTATGDYVYNNISSSFGGEKIYLDYSRYAGKQIRIGFYVESTVTNADNDLHLDNVQLNGYTRSDVAVSLCQYEDYADEVFTLYAEDLHVGVNNFSRFTTAKQNGQKDKLQTLTITVNPSATSEQSATICEGEVYENAGFNVQVPSTGDFYYKTTSVVTGCDSVVTLHLTVIPSPRTAEYDTICQGTSYQWHGKSFIANAVAHDTLTSLVTGCDSICTLYLTVTRPTNNRYDYVLCPGDTTYLGTTMITGAGSYTETLTSAMGCDSIVTLVVTVKTLTDDTIRAEIKEGEAYTDEHFIGIKKPGTYNIQTTDSDGCPLKITLILNYEGETALSDVNAENLAIMPNPVDAGANMLITGNFGTTEATVRVHSLGGALIKEEKATTLGGKITIQAPIIPGAYMVSLQTTGKQLFRSKILVK